MRRKLSFLISFIVVLGLGVNTLNAALIAQWGFDEGEGTTAFEPMSGYNGTIYGATWTAGVVGGALDFDGVNDRVDIGDIDEFEFGDQDFSICAWFYTKGTQNAMDPEPAHLFGGEIISKYNLSGNQRQWHISQEDSGFVRFYTSPDGITHQRLDSVGEDNKGKWVHIAAVRSGSTKLLYINGILDNTGTTDGVVTGKSAKVYIGCFERARKMVCTVFSMV